MDLFGSRLMLALKKQLDASMLRQRVIANNIANLNTPGFKKSSVSFEDQLRSALKKSGHPLPMIATDVRHFGRAGAGAVKGGPAFAGSGGTVLTNKKTELVGTELDPAKIGLTDSLANVQPVPEVERQTSHTEIGSSDPVAGVQPVVRRETATSTRTDGNNVDLEEQMTELAANTLLYQTAAQVVSRKLAALSYVISGGRR